ncbi:MAG: magnesium-translocating P-type ATPase [Myxococcota bacterium]
MHDRVESFDGTLGAWWSETPDALLARLGSRSTGLASGEARERLQRFGPNSLRPASRFAWLRLLGRQLASPLVAILVFAAAVSALVHDWIDAAIVLAILLGSALLGFTQEYRATRVLEKLRARVRIRTRVLRDGAPELLPTEALVPGDVVEVSAGNLIPADGVVLETRDLLVSQAALTGEAFPVEKQAGPVAAAAGLAERSNCVFMGTSVRSGTARVLVVRTGEATAYGEIARHLRLRPAENEFERGIRQYGYLLMRIGLVVVLLVFAAQYLLERPPIESLLFALALAVAISPELLPAIIEVTLSRGAHDMASHGVIVRRLDAIESFGSMDVLCTDKTGTLTLGVLDLELAADPAGVPSRSVLRDAWLNASLQQGLANPLDQAIVQAAAREAESLAPARKLDEIPYDFVRRRLGLVVEERDGPRLISKGALASVLEVCERVRESGEIVALDPERRARIEARFAAFGEDGARVLGVATRAVPRQERYARGDEAGMTFEGFLVFRDPPKPGVAAAIGSLARLGVAVKVVSGDNRHVTAHVAREVGLADPRLLTGRELDALGDEALQRVAREVDLFVEVDPNQKERILLALKKSGHVVGYLGDGINDASALHAADVGISVDGAVDVAKDAADFVLLEPDLDVLRRGIEHGRASFANTLKYVSITSSANFGNMLSMAVASTFLPFLPLLAKQILLNNLLSDLPMLTLPGDRVDDERIARARRWEVRPIRNFMLVFGLISSAFDMLTFGALWLLARGSVEVFRTGWFVESLLTELAIVLVVRTKQPLLRSRPGRLLMGTTVAVAGGTLLIPWLPGSALFDFVPLPAPVLAAILGITLAYVAASEWTKRRFALP